MSGKQSRPVIGKLVGAWGSGDRFRFADAPVTSPRSPSDVKIQTPRGPKNIYDLGHGVGLGIVAALEKSVDSGTGPDFAANKPVLARNLSRNSDPIPVKLPPENMNCGGQRKGSEEVEMDDDLEEDYTIVTCHGPNKDCNRAIVYCDNGVEIGGRSGVDDERSKNCDYVAAAAAFDISPAPARFGEDMTAYPGPDFLSSCHLCQKKLHGKDIYMYRGEKAFCSTGCRYRQIVMDERKEQCCSSEASRSAATDVSNPPYSHGQIFTTGILAT